MKNTIEFKYLLSYKGCSIKGYYGSKEDSLLFYTFVFTIMKKKKKTEFHEK